MSTAAERYFEREGGRADAFWAVRLDAKTVHLRRGDAGAWGQQEKKSFGSPALAQKFADDAVKKKLAEGYVERLGDALFFEGTGKKKMYVRVALDAEEVLLNGFRFPQETVDLSPMAQLEHAAELDLCSHKLKSIDLAPLVKATALRALSISHSGLAELTAKDLAPLAKCTKLEKLALNHLMRVDLSGLKGATSLRRLELINNSFKTLDLAPLAALKNLEKLYLQQNDKLGAVDLTPLSTLSKLQVVGVDAKCQVTGEQTLKARLQRST